MGAIATWVVLCGLLALTAGALVLAWVHGGLPSLSLHGWIALGLGTVLSLAVGFGLMALVFHSARHGYDDRVGPD